jgi:hypothetical protein
LGLGVENSCRVYRPRKPLLRPLLRRRRELLTELGRAAAEAVSELVRRGLGDEARPGVVVSIATAGDLVQWHPHLHLLTTDGGKTVDGSWQPLPEWDGVLVMGLFRERLLTRLVECHAISPEFVAKLVAWKHPGFCAHVGLRRSQPRCVDVERWGDCMRDGQGSTCGAPRLRWILGTWN